MIRRAVAAAAAAAVVASVSAITPVPTVNVPAYLGTWYQMYSDLSTFLFSSQYCVQATYGIFPNNTVSVHNRDRIGSVTGDERQIYGWASQDAKAQGILTVYLQGVPVGAPYWIVAIGPEEGNKYQWAVVSDELQISLFVLARNVTRFYREFNETVYSLLINEGFNTPVNSPVPTYQVGCPPWTEEAA